MKKDRKTMRNIRNAIRKNHDNNRFYKLDKVLKITRVKINSIENSQRDDAIKVGYEFGLNLYNPFTWILVIIPGTIEATFNGLREIAGEMGLSKYSEDVLNSIVEEVEK